MKIQLYTYNTRRFIDSKKILKKAMLTVKGICFFLLCFGTIISYAQMNTNTELRKQINNPLLSEEDRLDAFSLLAKEETKNESFNTFYLQNIEDTNTISNFLKAQMAFSYAYEKNNFTELKLSTDKVLMHEDCTSEDSIAAYNALSTYYNRQGYYNSAIENIVKVININNRKKDYLKSEFGYSSLASILMNQKLYKEAIENYKKSFSLETEYEWVNYPYSMMNNMGLAYHYLDMTDSALYYFNEVLTYLENEVTDTSKAVETDFFLGLVKGNIGDVYLEQGKYNEAEPLLLFDLETSLIANEKENASITRLNLAKVYLETNQYDKSKQYLDLAYIEIQRSKFRGIKQKYFLYSAQYYEKKGIHTESAAFYKKYINLNDSINAEVFKRKVVDHNLEFELLKKEEELSIAVINSEKDGLQLDSKKNQLYFTIGLSILLSFLLIYIYTNYRSKSKLSAEMILKNNEIIVREKALRKALDEKKLMLKEIHHRVKNNLQLVSSLLRLQAHEIDDPKVNLAIEESINRLTSISLIHQKLYMKENFQSIELKSYYESLIKQISDLHIDSSKTIVCETHISDVNLSIDNAIPIGLIVNEIISNSFKHAFKGKTKGIVSSFIEKKGNNVKIILRDNGLGILKKPKENTSFGMTLIYLLVEQINGRIDCYNDNGTVFKIEFTD